MVDWLAGALQRPRFQLTSKHEVMRKLPFLLTLVQNKNMSALAYGKFFAERFPRNIISAKNLAHRCAMEQSVYSADIIQGVISVLTRSLVELLNTGTRVCFDGLGTFTPTVESEGVLAPELYDVDLHVKGIHIRFIPTNRKGEEITSKKFKDLCTLKLVDFKDIRKITVPKPKAGGTKVVRIVTRKPIAQYKAERRNE